MIEVVSPFYYRTFVKNYQSDNDNRETNQLFIKPSGLRDKDFDDFDKPKCFERTLNVKAAACVEIKNVMKINDIKLYLSMFFGKHAYFWGKYPRIGAKQQKTVVMNARVARHTL